MRLLAATGALVAAAPAAGQAGENAGGGVARGTLSFAGPVRLGGGCGPTDFTFTGQSDTVVFNTVITAYVGPVTIVGTGRDGCPAGISQSGALNVTANGVGPTGSTLACGSLTGSYTRVATLVSVAVTGACSVNGFPAGEITFLSEAVVTPPLATTFQTAGFVAPFSVAPAV